MLLLHHTQEGWSPLHVASQNGFVDLVELLIDSGTNADIQNKVDIRK